MTQSLYRKYRPQRFCELVGQEHITTALRNGVRDDRVGHAYLFSGPRGTGKTTTARILAKALNCLDLGDDGEPCGACENCVAIAQGTFFDLAELDAASNNGVENVRDLIQSVNLGLGATAKRKVYLIDEVHMLTSAASNALLKTLEEPPEHVVFILATTDPQKVLPTIRSRTQHFDFHLFGADELTGLLGSVLEREGVAADPQALALLARRGAGSARDSLSLLDQALSLGAGALDTAVVQANFGGTPFEARARILLAAGNDDPAGAIVGVQEVLHSGVEPRRLADDLLGTLRDAFVHLAARGRLPHEGPAEEVPTLEAIGEALGAAGLTRCIDLLGSAIVDIRGPAAPDPRLVLEVAVVRCARRDARTPAESLLERLERLEARLDGGASGALPGSGPAAMPARRAPAAPAAAPAPPAAAPAGGGLGTADDASADALGADSPLDRSALGAHLRQPPAPVLRPRPAPGAPAADDASADASDPLQDDLAPAAEAGAAPVVAGSYDLDDAVLAWGNALGALAAPLRAVVQDAQPIAIEDGAIVFGVPVLRFEAINKRFRAEADTIRAGLAVHLGAPPPLKLRRHDFDRPDAFGGPPAPDRAVSSRAEEPPPEDDMVDLHDLVDAPDDDAPVDSATRLLEAFGGEIVEERPRSG